MIQEWHHLRTAGGTWSEMGHGATGQLELSGRNMKPMGRRALKSPALNDMN